METIWQVLIAEIFAILGLAIGYFIGKNSSTITKTVSSVESKLPHPASTTTSATPTVPTVPTTH